MKDLPNDGDKTRTSTARPSGSALTSDRLGDAWPEVSARLHRKLARRGVDPALRDDIVQEVAVRALVNQVPFTDSGDLYRWAATAASNLHVDHVRSGRRTMTDEVLAGMPDGCDVAHAAERRVALANVWRALALMRPGEREAILDSLGDDARARTSCALVKRHRARATLRKAVGGAIAWVGAIRARLGEVDITPVMQTAGAAVALSPVVALGVLGSPYVASIPSPVPVIAAPGSTGHDASAPASDSRRAGRLLVPGTAAMAIPQRPGTPEEPTQENERQPIVDLTNPGTGDSGIETGPPPPPPPGKSEPPMACAELPDRDILVCTPDKLEPQM
jgi:DNA-directed RNA polymerase specialized sigma24 family protein